MQNQCIQGKFVHFPLTKSYFREKTYHKKEIQFLLQVSPPPQVSYRSQSKHVSYLVHTLLQQKHAEVNQNILKYTISIIAIVCERSKLLLAICSMLHSF